MKKFLKRIIHPKIIFIIKFLLKFILFLPFLPFCIFIIFIRPIILIRIGSLYSDRIGHFAGNTELYLCELKAGINKPDSKFIDLFFLSGKISNNQLLKMWKRELNIISSILLYPIYFWFNIFFFTRIHIIKQPTSLDRDVYNLFDKYPPFLKFTKKEEDIGRKTLLSYGLKENDKFICLNVRDSAYLSDPGYDYHSYRDCDINNYIYTATKLSELGYTVFRMGAKVKNKLITSNPKIIDYASNGMRSEFMDIYLGAKCYFSISTSSGWDSIPYIFRRPIVYAPVQPINNLFTFSNKFIGIFKHHLLLTEKRLLSIREIFKSNVFNSLETNDFKKYNIKLLEPSENEIWEVTHEMLNNIKSDFKNINYSKKQDKIVVFYENYGNLKKKFHGIIKGQVGSKFIEKYF